MEIHCRYSTLHGLKEGIFSLTACLAGLGWVCVLFLETQTTHTESRRNPNTHTASVVWRLCVLHCLWLGRLPTPKPQSEKWDACMGKRAGISHDPTKQKSSWPTPQGRDERYMLSLAACCSLARSPLPCPSFLTIGNTLLILSLSPPPLLLSAFFFPTSIIHPFIQVLYHPPSPSLPSLTHS